MEKGHQLYEQAMTEVPVGWYETILGKVPFLVLFGVLIYSVEFPDIHTHQRYAVVAALTYILGCVADYSSTEDVKNILSTINQEYGVTVPVVEQHAILPSDLSVESDRQQVAAWIDYAVLVVATVIPQLGMALGVGKIIDGYVSNRRMLARLQVLLSSLCSIASVIAS